jgi:hypothetical protein
MIAKTVLTAHETLTQLRQKLQPGSFDKQHGSMAAWS